MKTRRAILIVIVGLGFVCGMVFLLWQKESNQPMHLKLVRRSVEQGKPVVFFRVEGANNRRIQISYVEKIKFGGATERPFESAKTVSDFWAPSQTLPLDDERRSREAFGVIEPSDAESWKLRAWVKVQVPSRARSVREIKALWERARSRGWSFSKAAQFTWRAYFATPSEAVEIRVIVSDVISNTVAITEQVSK